MAEAARPGAVLRNPFVWAFLLGALVLTLMRPCLRRIPAPPAVTGRFPAITLIGREGEVIDAGSLRGDVWVVHLLPGECGTPCGEANGRMREMGEAFEELRVGGIRLLSVVPGPAGEPLRTAAAAAGAGGMRWIWAAADEGAARALRAAIPEEGAAPPAGRLAIVDAAGDLRGAYPADTDGFNEVYNRVRHVRDAANPR